MVQLDRFRSACITGAENFAARFFVNFYAGLTTDLFTQGALLGQAADPAGFFTTLLVTLTEAGLNF